MKEFNFTEYQGKRILVAVMYIHEVQEALQAIEELSQIVAREPERSVRILLDVTDGKIFDEATALWKRKLPIFDKHVLRGAVVGPAWMRTITSVVLMAARIARLDIAKRVKAFGTLEEARDFVAGEG